MGCRWNSRPPAPRPPPTPGPGLLTLIPLGLTLIPFLLAWRAGRRLARASYTDQLWQALLGSWLVYAAFGTATGFVCRTPDVVINPWHAMFIPLIPYALGMVIGARREAGSWSRLIGVDAVDWLSRTSQHSRWAGSYLGSAAKAGFVAVLSALALAALLLAVDLFIHWNLVVAVYEALDAGAVGGAALTIAQLGFLPNLVVFALAWASGSGFAMGVGSQVGPAGHRRGTSAFHPGAGRHPGRAPGLRLRCLDRPRSSLVCWPAGGSSAKGENHFDEWLSIKVRARWFTATVSTLVLGVLCGLAAGLLIAGLTWVARGSAGIGRLTSIGPDPLWTGVWVAAEVAAGVVIGYAAGPWLEREQAAKEEDAELVR
jgi:hypothetical protein